MWDSRQLPIFLFRPKCWRALFFYFFLLQILKNITWYAERVLTEISLGSLLILVVIRTIQYNMTRTRVRLMWGTCEFLTSAAWIQFQTGGGILFCCNQLASGFAGGKKIDRSAVLTVSELVTQFLWCRPVHWVQFSKDFNSGVKLIFSWEERVP